MSKFKPTRNYNKSASSFWMDESIYDYETKQSGKDLIKLAGYQRAIGNFVKILTNKNIPIRYASSDMSYTDGERIVISAKMDDNNFDPTVGLALHEGSHILLTDFKILKHLEANIRKSITPEQKNFLIDRYGSLGGFVMMERLKNILNIIEDRRIDLYVYKNAPGYQAYYKALYAKYFNNAIIDKALKSKMHRNEDWESYMFRLINIANPKRDINALKYFPSIYNLIDLQNIGRLKNTEEAFRLALDVFFIIEQAVAKAETSDNNVDVKMPKPKQQMTNVSTPSDSSPSSPTPVDKSNLEQAIDNIMSEIDKDEVNDDDDDNTNTTGGSDNEVTDTRDENDSDDEIIEPSETSTSTEELSTTEMSKLAKALSTQKDFIDGNVSKSKLSNKENSMIKAIQESESTYKEASYEQYDYYNKDQVIGVKTVPVLLVRNVTPLVINTDAYNGVFLSDNNTWNSRHINEHLEHVNSGLVLGAKLGKKLKIRNEERDTKFTRLKTGNIDKRLIASLGYGAESVFQKMEQFRFKPMYFHLSIDASGSMNGDRFNNSIRLAAAIGKAADMVGNIRVVIDVRTTVSGGRETKPFVAIVYDSKRDPLSKMVYNLSHTSATGATPEGLCFDVIMNDIIKNSQNTDAVFFNLSDGEPCFDGYSGNSAIVHTKKMVNKMIKRNINVISYFISDYDASGRVAKNFREMYGKDAKFIDTRNIIQVSNSINERMLKVC